MTTFSIITAKCSKTGGIGVNETLPWRIPSDMRLFKDITTGEGMNVVIMGRKTWESLPVRHRPLSNRTNLIISSTLTTSAAENTNVYSSLPAALSGPECKTASQRGGRVYLVGGALLYAEAIRNINCSTLFVTNVTSSPSTNKNTTPPPQFDTFFPEISQDEYIHIPGDKKWVDGEYELELQIWYRRCYR